MHELLTLALIILIVFYLKNFHIFLSNFQKFSYFKKQIRQHANNPFDVDIFNELAYLADYYDEKCLNAVYNAIVLFILGIVLMLLI